MLAYEILGRLKWKGGLDKHTIVIRHRGVSGDEKRIPGSRVVEVKKSYFVYNGLRETVIPMHRVLRIEYNDKNIWKRGITP